MSDTMQQVVDRYLVERRRLGFELRIAGAQIERFARFADASGFSGPLTLALQLDWARDRVTRPITSARRLELLRPFAQYYRQFEPASDVPARNLFGPGHRRLAPHIYTEHEIRDLLEEAGRLAPTNGLRPATYRTLFGLIAATGMRVSEALNLQRADVDFAAGALTVRRTKFTKSRLLPLHPSTVQALEHYAAQRDRTRAQDLQFFVSATGRPLPSRTVHSVFEGIRTQLGWVARGDHPHPRIHDLRHTFAVRRMQLWHQNGVPIEQATFWLCTYLGHAKISDTYWYLTATPELLGPVGARFERFALGGGQHDA